MPENRLKLVLSLWNPSLLHLSRPNHLPTWIGFTIKFSRRFHRQIKKRPRQFSVPFSTSRPQPTPIKKTKFWASPSCFLASTQERVTLLSTQSIRYSISLNLFMLRTEMLWPPKSMKSGWKMIDMWYDSTTNQFPTSWRIEHARARSRLYCSEHTLHVQISTNVNIYSILVACDYATMLSDHCSASGPLTPELQEVLRQFDFFACFTRMFLSVHGDKIWPEVLENIRKKIARQRFNLPELFSFVFYLCVWLLWFLVQTHHDNDQAA